MTPGGGMGCFGGPPKNLTEVALQLADLENQNAELRRFLNRVSWHFMPETRWPCHECDRPHDNAPLRIVRRITEDGNEYQTGCTLCNAHDLLTEISKYLRADQ